jgi:Ca-activated chloride channel homolog
MCRTLWIALVLCSAAPAAQAAALALVLAFDVSASVTPNSYILQRNGTAHAFEDPRLIESVAAAPGGIEALVLEWSDPNEATVTVPWTRIAGRRSALGFAKALLATTRSSRGLTGLGAALAAAGAQFARLPEPAARRVIDISGDGIANIGEMPRQARDRLVAAGVTINGLAIVGATPWLGDYYRRNVIGGPGAFVVAVRDFTSFAVAIRQKLATEVAGAAAPTPLRCSRYGSARTR